MAEYKNKNRRYRGAKISEHRLHGIVQRFCEDKTVKETAKETRISEPTVRNIFMRLRERLHEHGFIRVHQRTSGTMPARFVFGRKHRGVPEKYVSDACAHVAISLT